MDPLQRTRSFGWWSLLCWLSLGLVLEALHGFKVGWFLDVANEGRRLQLDLAHTHGTLIALVNLAFAATIPPAAAQKLGSAAFCLNAAGVVMPVGFLLGGVFSMGADPGLPVLLVPLGGLLLFTGVLLTVQALRSTVTNKTANPPTETPAESEPKQGKRRK